MKIRYLLCLVALTAACVADVTPVDLSPMKAELADISKAVSPGLKAQLAAERNQRRAAALRAGHPFYADLRECGPEQMANLDKKGQISGSEKFCVLREKYNAGIATTSTATAGRMLSLLEQYFAALEDLTTSRKTEVTAAANSMFLAAEELHKLLPKKKDAEIKQRPALAKGIGFLTDTYRKTELRRIIRSNDGTINDAILWLANYLSETNPPDPIISAKNRLDETENAMKADPTDPIALQNFERAHTAYIKARKSSPVAKLYQLSAMHRSLAYDLDHSLSLDSTSSLLGDAADLKSSIK